MWAFVFAKRSSLDNIGRSHSTCCFVIKKLHKLVCRYLFFLILHLFINGWNGMVGVPVPLWFPMSLKFWGFLISCVLQTYWLLDCFRLLIRLYAHFLYVISNSIWAWSESRSSRSLKRQNQSILSILAPCFLGTLSILTQLCTTRSIFVDLLLWTSTSLLDWW